MRCLACLALQGKVVFVWPVSGECAWHQPLFSDSEESAMLWEKSPHS